MYYLINEHANIDERIITEQHPAVQKLIEEALEFSDNWNAEKYIQWMWGIEEKSENLFNLIKKDDLIIGNECEEYEDIPYICTSNFENTSAIECGIGTYLDKNEKAIRKIFRLDSKGNYKLLWTSNYKYHGGR